MRISKLHLVVCAAALCASITVLRADDSQEQAAARAALEAKMRQLNTQAASTNVQTTTPATPEQRVRSAATTTAPAVEVTPSGAAVKAPTHQPPTMAATANAAPARTTKASPSTRSNSGNSLFAPVPPPSGSYSAGTAPAVSGQPTHQPPAMTATSNAAPVQTTKASPSTRSNSGNSLYAPVPPPSGSYSAGTAPAASGQPSNGGQTPPPAVVQPPIFMGTLQSTNAFYPGKKLGLKPITGPPLPISPRQEAQLQALLERYDANAVTPEQYQAARAKILAEPK